MVLLANLCMFSFFVVSLLPSAGPRFMQTKQGTLKTLDSAIKRYLPDGRETSISSKCTEIDREVGTYFDV